MTTATGPWLVLGAAGRLGVALQRTLSSAGVDFVALTRAEADFGNPVDFAGLSASQGWPKFAVIANCAGFTDVDAAEQHPQLAMRLNAELVAEAMTYAGAVSARFLQISTNYVFDGRLRRRYLVTDETAPLQQYGRSKLAGERAALAALGEPTVAEVAIVRTGWLYGQHPTRADLPDRLAARLIGRQPVQLTDQLGAPTWASDLAEYLLRLGSAPGAVFNGIHHAMADGSVSWYEFGLQLAHDLGVNAELVQPNGAGAQVGARRPEFGLLQPTAVDGYQIPDWSSGWTRYRPEFLAGLGHSGLGR